MDGYDGGGFESFDDGGSVDSFDSGSLDSFDDSGFDSFDDSSLDSFDDSGLDTLDDGSFDTIDEGGLDSFDGGGLDTLDDGSFDTINDGDLDSFDDSGLDTLDDGSFDTIDDSGLDDLDDAGLDTLDDGSLDTIDDSGLDDLDDGSLDTLDDGSLEESGLDSDFEYSEPPLDTVPNDIADEVDTLDSMESNPEDSMTLEGEENLSYFEEDGLDNTEIVEEPVVDEIPEEDFDSTDMEIPEETFEEVEEEVPEEVSEEISEEEIPEDDFGETEGEVQEDDFGEIEEEAPEDDFGEIEEQPEEGFEEDFEEVEEQPVEDFEGVEEEAEADFEPMEEEPEQVFEDLEPETETDFEQMEPEAETDFEQPEIPDEQGEADVEEMDDFEPEAAAEEEKLDPEPDTAEEWEEPDSFEDIEKTEESGSPMDDMTKYLSEHNYGPEDYNEYSKDPEWQELNNRILEADGREPIDYSNSETFDEMDESGSPMDDMSKYLSEHNYSMADYPEYSKDPEWQELNNRILEADGKDPIDYSNSETTGEIDEVIDHDTAMSDMAEYLSEHNYGAKDYNEYKNDPEWQELNNRILESEGREPIDYSDPETTSKIEYPGDTHDAAMSDMAEYLSEHNYGMEDYEEYSKDPEWQELNNRILYSEGKEPIDYSAQTQETSLEDYDFETSPETHDNFNPETSGEFAHTTNPYQEGWEKFAEEYDDGNEADWDSLKEVPFAGDEISEGTDIDPQIENVNEVPKDYEGISEWINDVNPNFDEFDVDSPYSNNCGSCAYAVYQRMEGIDSNICATAENIPDNASMEEITGLKMESSTPGDIEKMLLEQGDGAHAIIGVDRAEGPGHWFNAAVIDGKVYAIDGQNGQMYDWPPDYGDVVHWDVGIKKEM